MAAEDVSRNVTKYFAGRRETFGALVAMVPTTPPESGVSRFRLTDGSKTYELSGMELRGDVLGGGLLSPQFEVRKSGTDYTFAGRGHGHGVGLCQWGARGQAQAGKNCLAILGHYYPGSRVVVLENRIRPNNGR